MEPFFGVLLASLAFALFLAAALTAGFDSRPGIEDHGSPRWV